MSKAHRWAVGLASKGGQRGYDPRYSVPLPSTCSGLFPYVDEPPASWVEGKWYRGPVSRAAFIFSSLPGTTQLPFKSRRTKERSI